VAAEFVNKRVSGVKVVPHHCKIQDLPISFYKLFKIVISGLDSINARRYLNELIVGLPEKDADGTWNPDTFVPLIDGGTEGWMGQARVIFPYFGPCFECLLHLFPADPLSFQECTVAVTPRQPEHCIVYAMSFSWKEDATRKDEKIDGDDPEHIQWLFEKATIRANEFGIDGVSYKLTQGVVKKIIPAIASTNGIIGAACANEAYKIATMCLPNLENWMMYNAVESVYTSTTQYEKNPECLVCAIKKITVNLPPKSTLQQFIDRLVKEPQIFGELSDPSVSKYEDGQMRVLHGTGALRFMTQANLEKFMEELVHENDELIITDKGKQGKTVISVRWSLD